MKGYYNWNAAWGYMQFPTKFNFDAHDTLDMGLYFAHGRWYNQDTGLWLSPNEKGDYLYGGDGQDPVNVGLVLDIQAQQNQQGRYIHTKFGAIIDISHFAVGLAKRVIEQVEGGQRVTLDNQLLCPGVCEHAIPVVGGVPFHSAISVDYGLTPPITDKYGVALAIWEDYERKCTVPQKLDTKTMFFVRPLNLIPARARGIVLQTLPA